MTDLPDVSPGATWHCIDVHLHTPGVHSFALPSGTDVTKAEHRERIADRYVERLREAGIDVAVITDYQGVRTEWFELIRERAAGITVLPGAEMSIGSIGRGLHLLLVCDADTDPSRIHEVLRREDRSGEPLFTDREQHRHLDLRSPLDDTLRNVRNQLGCLVIAAHASSGNGALREYGVENTARLVRDGLIDAIDMCEDAPAKLRSTNVLTKEQAASIACTLSSDPKGLDDVGTRTTSDGRPALTWVKLSTVDVPALRLALHDPQTRVLTHLPDPPRHTRIMSMEVEGAGFLGGLAIRFNDDLTALIGGKGSGKSAILEALRYTLDAPVFSDQSERAALVRAALASGGRIRVVVERAGPVRNQRYEVVRVLDQDPRVTDLSTGAGLGVSPLEVFGSDGPPVILLQREIQAVARDDAFRRGLLNQIIGDEARVADRAVQRTIEEIRRNERELDETERQLAQRDEHVETLRRLDAEIAFFEQQGIAEKLTRQGAASADRARIDTAARQLDEASSMQADQGARLLDLLDDVESQLRSTGSDGTEAVHERAAETARLRNRLRATIASITTDLERLRSGLSETQRSWEAGLSSLDDELRRIQAELGQGPLDAGRFIEATRQRVTLRPVVEGLERKEDEHVRLRSQRTSLLQRLQDERRRGFALRARAAQSVNEALAGALTMRIEYLGDREEFFDALAGIFRGSRVSTEALRRVAGRTGTDGVELVRRADAGSGAIGAHYSITQNNADRIAAWLADPERRRLVETLAPGDGVEIRLRVDGEPRELARLSDGQKATALLLLVFAQSGRPLMLDQPEDDLDNRFVYNDVVALLRAEKGLHDPARHRQIIVATHNANIPVNGDAELVLSLAAEGGRCSVRARGSIDDRQIREEIRTVLEGGADAFRRRAEKYGGLDDA